MPTDTIAVEFKQDRSAFKKYVPLVLMILVIALDQITKFLIVKNIPLTYPFSVGASYFNDFLRIIHVCNPGIAFSIGQSWSVTARALLFRIVPLLVIIAVLVVYVKNNEFTTLQRWAISGVVGGGLGNLIDRFFRAEGVVDFIDVKFFGIFGLERWPTFNVADAAVVVCGIMLLLAFIFEKKPGQKVEV